MKRIVMKFGGSSLAGADKIKNAAQIIAQTYQEGHAVLVVVSAQGDSTDELKDKAAALTPHPVPREHDVLLAAGEQISMALMAMYLQAMGHTALSLCGWQAGILTDTRHGDARILDIDTRRMEHELGEGKIVIVAGFQGVDELGDITTIGRGGSDTTAVAIAAALHADACHIYTDVSGVFSADPRRVPGTVLHKTLVYDEMLELASAGAQVLHNRAVGLAKKHDVVVQVRSSFVPDPGTEIRAAMEDARNVSAVTSDACVALVRLREMDGHRTATLLRRLADEGVGVDMLAQHKDGLSFSVWQRDVQEVQQVLMQAQEALGFSQMHIDTGVCKLSAVGAGLARCPCVCADMLQTLEQENVPVHAISVGELKVSLLVAQEDAKRALVAIHRALFED